jgi:hypothetical protein
MIIMELTPDDLEFWTGKEFPAEQRRTLIVANDAEEEVRVWTVQDQYLGQLRHNANFTEIKSGYIGNAEWAEFVIPAVDWNPATGATSSHLKEEVGN